MKLSEYWILMVGRLDLEQLFYIYTRIIAKYRLIRNKN